MVDNSDLIALLKLATAKANMGGDGCRCNDCFYFRLNITRYSPVLNGWCTVEEKKGGWITKLRNWYNRRKTNIFTTPCNRLYLKDEGKRIMSRGW